MLEFEANTFESMSAINNISTEIVDLKQENTDLKNKIADIINGNMRANLVFPMFQKPRETTSIQQDSCWLA